MLGKGKIGLNCIPINEIFNLLPCHVYWMDRNNIFQGCNKLQSESAGLKSPLEIVGKTNFDMPWKDSAEKLNQINNEIMATGIPKIAEEDAILNGKKVVFLSQKIPLKSSDRKVIGLFGISVNITEFKSLEIALERRNTIQK